MKNPALMTLVTLLPLLALSAILTAPSPARGQDPVLYGLKARMGGRYDDVRMCVATPAGVSGGPAMDVSAFASWRIHDGVRLELDLPVMRPILFGAAFRMLQFEPSVMLTFLLAKSPRRQYRAGPVAGLSFHYGPDEDSEPSGEGRTASFFAMGPTGGGYADVTFLRPRGSFDVRVGLTLYTTRLFSLDDEADHQGLVAGGSLDIGFLFH